MTQQWDIAEPGVLELPSRCRVRGRALHRSDTTGTRPEFGLYLLTRAPSTFPWESRWVDWPDFRVPRDSQDAIEALRETWQRAASRRVEVACTGGRGRTGTALACLALLDGLAPADAVRFVRTYYHHRAVETPWQRRFVSRVGWTAY